MAGFVQIIEMRTTKFDEVLRLTEEFRASRAAAGTGAAPARAMHTADRDRDGYYLSIVEFDSYEDAMANSQRPETREFAQKMAALCDEPPRFYNLEVRQAWTLPAQRSESPSATSATTTP